MSDSEARGKTPTDTIDAPPAVSAPALRNRITDRTDPTPEAECRNCGRDLSPAIARVVGDNDGCVRRCKACTDGITRTSVAARAARGDGLRVASEGRMGGAE